MKVYTVYALFDADRSMRLDALDCLCLVDALFRAAFFAEPGSGTLMAFGSFSRSFDLSSEHEASLVSLAGADVQPGRPGAAPDGSPLSPASAWDIPIEASPCTAATSPTAPGAAHGRELRTASTPGKPLAARGASATPAAAAPAAAAPRPPRHSQGPAAAAQEALGLSAAMAAAQATLWLGSTYGDDPLGEARAETLRLRRELEELQLLETMASAAPTLASLSPAGSLQGPDYGTTKPNKNEPLHSSNKTIRANRK